MHARHPGWAQRAAHLHHHTYTAEQVIVAAHAYGSAKLLLHMQHKGRLTGLSSELGQRARTNSEQLLAITRTHGEWKRDPERIHITPGSVSITSGVWPDPETSIEPAYWGVGNDLFAFLVTYHQHGEQKHPTASWLKEIVEHPSEVIFRRPAPLGRADSRHALLADDRHVDRAVLADGLLRSGHRHAALRAHPGDRGVRRPGGEQMGGHEGALPIEVINRTASAHFIGGIPIGESSETGAVDPYLRMFGQPGLHVMDGSVMPANPGVNPSLTITALAERAMSLWPNKGDTDSRPPLGSGYERVDPVMPHRPFVPAGAPGELRLDARKSDVIPDYPY